MIGRRAEDFTDVEHEIGTEHGIHRHVFLEIDLAEIWASAELVEYVPTSSRSMMREQAAGRSTDKGSDPGQDDVPGFRVQRGIVNPADQLEQGFVRIHAQAPPSIRPKLHIAVADGVLKLDR